jgi:hypothetical protein
MMINYFATVPTANGGSLSGILTIERFLAQLSNPNTVRVHDNRALGPSGHTARPKGSGSAKSGAKPVRKNPAQAPDAANRKP